jgi:uncharacterized protein
VNDPGSRSLAARYLTLLLAHRAKVALAISVLTVLLGACLTRVRVYMDFFDLYPPRHPYIQLYKEYRKMFGGANVLVVAVERPGGTIFNLETMGKIDRITRFLMDSPGVDPTQVISLTHPKLKTVEVSGLGILVRPLMWPAFPRDQADLDRVREAVYRNRDVRGFFASSDDQAAAIFAGFWEEGTDLSTLLQRVQQVVAQESDANHRIYVTGYPMLFAWIVSYLRLTFVVMGVTFTAIALLLWFYFRTWTGVWVPMFSALLSSVWALGFAGLFGLTVNPLGIVVFLLITARALSHSVQSMERYHDEYRRLGDRQQAIVASYVSLFPPATVSIAADGLAILTLATASIPLIQNLAYVSSFWVATMVVSVVTLHPVLLSYLSPPRHDPRFGTRFSDFVYRTINRGFVRLARGRVRYAVATTMFVALALGLTFSQLLKVGDLSVGKALLFDSHPYNRAFDFINSKFVGSAQLIIIAEGDRPGAIQDRNVLEKLEAFQRHMEQSEDTGGSISITNLLKRIFRVYHEGEPRWETLPHETRDLGQLFFTLESSTRPGEMDRFFSPGYRNATVTVFYRSYSNEVIKRAIERAKQFIAANPLEHVRFRLAGGLMGVLAAVNEEVEWSYRFNIGLVLLTVFVLSFLTYRSVIASLIVMIPSIVAQPLSEAVMYLGGIDLNIQSLPVAAIGIGIGIDYGYYLLSRIVEELSVTRDFDAANERALMSTGRAILFTGTTLTASVIFWLWFPMKFQAEMAFLLATLLAFHVIGALVFIPTMVSLLKPRFASLLALESPHSDRERVTRRVGGVRRKGG